MTNCESPRITTLDASVPLCLCGRTDGRSRIGGWLVWIQFLRRWPVLVEPRRRSTMSQLPYCSVTAGIGFVVVVVVVVVLELGWMGTIHWMGALGSAHKNEKPRIVCSSLADSEVCYCLVIIITTLTSIVGSGYLCGSVPLSLSHSRSVQSSVMSRKLTTLATMFLDSGTVNQQQKYF